MLLMCSLYLEYMGILSAYTLVNTIFAHQGFCVYKALAHLGMITCILTARRYTMSRFIVALTNQVERINVSHYATMNNKTSVKHN